MNSLIIEPKNNKQLEEVISFLKEMKINFKDSTTYTKNKPYNKDWVEMMGKSEADFKAGRVHKIDLDEIWK